MGEGEAAFGRAVEEFLDALGLSPDELAEQLGVSGETVRNWTRGRPPRHDRVFELERFFDRQPGIKCSPGTLSRPLRYLPVYARPVLIPEDALRADKSLPIDVVETLIDVIKGARKRSRERGGG